MNWISVLNDLYEKNACIAGKMVDKGDRSTQKLILLPISHTTVKAQVEIKIDSNGKFLRASKVEKEDATTIIPVTEESGSRTSSAVNHPLCDNLKYIAGDYGKYISVNKKSEKKKSKDYAENYQAYLKDLRNWCSSPYSHPKAIAVLRYLEKGTLISDLISSEVLMPDEKGKYSEKITIQGISQTDAFVRFRVESVRSCDPEQILSDSSGRFRPEVWLDHTLQQSYIDYYRSLDHRMGLCYLTGEKTHISELHPKKIRNEGDGAKLISSNDDKYFTFRGRFNDKSEAFAIGYEPSQKAHNALKWIIRKQGYTRDGLCMVAWETNLIPIISPFQDTYEIADSRFYDEEEPAENDTNYMGANAFNAAVNGYISKLDVSSNMVIMAFDAATPGRLSITYFNRLVSSVYIENIRHWHETCSWLHEKRIDKKIYRFEGMVSLEDIPLLLYGIEEKGRIELKTNRDGKAPLKIATFNRLLPCIIERRKIPDDIVRTAIQRVAITITYEIYNWKRILSLACSLVRKQKYDKDKGVWTLALNTECTDRSYLYGRLLATADRIEYLTYEKNEGRQTNAKRFMNVFSQRPFRTWKIIEERIEPYLNKLSTGQKIYYSRILDSIYSLFTENEFSNDSKLDGLYLLGYHSQSHSFFMGKAENNEEGNEE